MAAQEAKQQAAEKPAVEKQTNCLGCGKPIKRLKRYYREGKFYCNKKCWYKNVKLKQKEAKNDKE